ncbi:MAG TPA: tyrosine 2,3-aminomutase [Pyrinomonadaceae bacterium]|jgi:histidine ammonia-lyase/tyrosine ammonia-lyase
MRLKGDRLSIFDVYEVAVNGAKVELDAQQMEKVAQTYERVQKWGEAKQPIYGVNTGFGELIHAIIPPQFKSELQYNLLRTHAAGGGQPFADEVVRAIMTVRLNCLVRGFSGTSPQALTLLSEFLNRGIHPVIPQQGSLGASGDLAPLSHMALPLIGDGYVRFKNEVRRSSEVLEEEGLKPITPGFKEALSFINGTSAMTGTACVALVKAFKLLQLGIIASVDFIQCLGGSTRAYDPRGHELKNHHGQIAVARSLRELLAGSSLTREHAELMKTIYAQTIDSDDVVDTQVYLQHAYTLRCIPQILGPVLDTFNFCRQLLEEEVNSSNDNPLFFQEAEDSFHGGNFHGQYIAMVSDYTNIALTEIGVLAERQLNRLLDPDLNNDLPAFLAHGQSGLFCGFEGGQYLATSIASENLDLAAPSSVKTIPSNGQNQDVVSMGLNSARKSLQLCENVTTILGVLVAACNQASHFIGAEKFNPVIQELHKEVGSLVPLYQDDTPISEHMLKVRDFVTSERAWAYLDRHVKFDGAAK